MRTSALVRLSSGIAVIALGAALSAPSAQAALPDPAAPVANSDSVALYPYGSAIVDVLANDTDPGDPDGSQLALCRLPTFDFSDILFGDGSDSVMIADAGGLVGEAGDLMVTTTRGRLATPATVDYYICNTTHLTPAVLTVTTREVKPVTVRKAPGKPGRLKVVNHNDRRVMMVFFNPRGDLFHSVNVGAHDSRVVWARSKKTEWMAMIGTARNSGSAGHGRVSGIKVDPKHSKPSKGDDIDVESLFGGLLGRVR